MNYILVKPNDGVDHQNCAADRGADRPRGPDAAGNLWKTVGYFLGSTGTL